MATDWAKLRSEYITTSITLRELADKHGIKAAGVMRRAANEYWEAERKQESARVSRAVINASAEVRVAELDKFNADDLKMARAIRARAAQMMATATVTSPQDLRAIAGAVDAAQKVGRLALGVSTNSNEITGKDGTPLAPPVFNISFENGGPGQ